MKETLTIEGERFIGSFRASRRTGEFWEGSEYTECKYEGYWYDGAGFIEDKHRGEKHFFALHTPHFRQYVSEDNYTLEESIVNYNQSGPFYWDPKPQLIGGAYRKIVDISLGEIVSQVRQSEEGIPVVEPKRLEFEYLVKMGYCADRNGQLNFQFST